MNSEHPLKIAYDAAVKAWNYSAATRAMGMLFKSIGPNPCGFPFPTREEFKDRYRTICERWPGVYLKADADVYSSSLDLELDQTYTNDLHRAIGSRWLSDRILGQDCTSRHFAVSQGVRTLEWATAEWERRRQYPYVEASVVVTLEDWNAGKFSGLKYPLFSVNIYNDPLEFLLLNPCMI